MSYTHLWRNGGAILLVQLDNDPETHQNILLIFNLGWGEMGRGGSDTQSPLLNGSWRGSRNRASLVPRSLGMRLGTGHAYTLTSKRWNIMDRRGYRRRKEVEMKTNCHSRGQILQHQLGSSYYNLQRAVEDHGGPFPFLTLMCPLR